MWMWGERGPAGRGPFRVLSVVIPPSLFTAQSDGTGQREGYQALAPYNACYPLAKIVSEELTLKLGGTVQAIPGCNWGRRPYLGGRGPSSLW